MHEALVGSVLLKELSSVVVCARRVVCNFKQGKTWDCKCCSCVRSRSLVCPDAGAVPNRQWKLRRRVIPPRLTVSSSIWKPLPLSCRDFSSAFFVVVSVNIYYKGMPVCIQCV